MKAKSWVHSASTGFRRHNQTCRITQGQASRLERALCLSSLVTHSSSLISSMGRTTSLGLALYPTRAKPQAGANAPRTGERQKCGVSIQMQQAVAIW